MSHRSTEPEWWNFLVLLLDLVLNQAQCILALAECVLVVRAPLKLFVADEGQCLTLWLSSD